MDWTNDKVVILKLKSKKYEWYRIQSYQILHFCMLIFNGCFWLRLDNDQLAWQEYRNSVGLFYTMIFNHYLSSLIHKDIPNKYISTIDIDIEILEWLIISAPICWLLSRGESKRERERERERELLNAYPFPLGEPNWALWSASDSYATASGALSLVHGHVISDHFSQSTERWGV